MKPIYPCLWFNHQAKEAAEYYCSIFPESVITTSNSLATLWTIQGSTMMGLNGGPQFKPNPSISMFVTCDTEDEVNTLFEKLSDQGSILMPLNRYDWSERYGWCNDQFGVSWQIYKGQMSDVGQKVVPLLMYANKQYGHAQEAIQLYTSLFKPSKVDGVMLYSEGDAQGKVMHGQFGLHNSIFMAMDAPGVHDFNFNEGVSLVVSCETQEHIDEYWNTLIADGGEESMCGWCKDKFGVSWQIIPSILPQLLSNPDKREAVIAAFLKMRKFDIATLLAI